MGVPEAREGVALYLIYTPGAILGVTVYKGVVSYVGRGLPKWLYKLPLTKLEAVCKAKGWKLEPYTSLEEGKVDQSYTAAVLDKSPQEHYLEDPLKWTGSEPSD